MREKRTAYILIYLDNRPNICVVYLIKMDTPDTTSEGSIQNSSNSNPKHIELLKQI